MNLHKILHSFEEAEICTDGAEVCTGFKSGIANESKTKRPMVNEHTVFSTERLLPQKKLSQELQEVNLVVKCVNFIKGLK